MSKDYKFMYMLLDRLRQDCDYYLGYGGKSKKSLWALDENEQIQKMYELYDSVPVKPEWLSREQIDRYAKEMGVDLG